MTPDAPATLDYQSRFAPAESSGELGRLAGYAIRRLISHGGMGEVYEAEELSLGRPVALKVMLGEIALKAEARARFLREARSAAAVVHDHIVRIYQVGEDRGLLFIAMELLRGSSLANRLNGAPFEAPEILRIAKECAAGLSAAHAAGLIHRDIKPANLWLETGSGRVKILDFGLARSAGDGTLTSTGQIFGTPAYIAPEQASGRPVDHRADLFSLGCVLYELATGRRPFRGDNLLVVLNSIANDTPPPPHELNPAIPAGLSQTIERLIAKDPLDRPESAAVLLERLNRNPQYSTPLPVARAVAAPAPRGEIDFVHHRLLGQLEAADDASRRRDFKRIGIYFGLFIVATALGAAAAGFNYGHETVYRSRIASDEFSFIRFLTMFCGISCGVGITLAILHRIFYSYRLRRIIRQIRKEFPAETGSWGAASIAVDSFALKNLLDEVRSRHR